MPVSVQTPYPVITDIDGSPLDDGYIWIGVDGLDPVANPQNAYWDAALTDLATQPVRTRGGYALDGTNRSRLFTATNYSIRVDNQNGSTVYQSLSENGLFCGNVTASGVVTAAGVTVQDGIWDQGNQTATAGGLLRVDKLLEDNAIEPLDTRGGYWPSAPVYVYAGVSKAFDDSEVTGGAGSPFAAFFVNATNNNTASDMCGQIVVANTAANNRTAFGLNVLATSSPGTTNVKLIGLEVDLQPSGSSTVSSNSIGVAINAFNVAMAAPAIQLGSVGGGSFNNGLVIGGIASSGAGVSGQAAATMGSLINTGVATYTQDAIIVTNGRKIRFAGTAGTHAKIYNDGSNNVRNVLGDANWVWRDKTDTSTIMALTPGGNLDMQSGGALLISGTQVVAARQAAVADAAGGATVDAQARTAINTLLARLRTHGLIAP